MCLRVYRRSSEFITMCSEFRAGLTNVGALFRKMCGAPSPPPMPPSGDYVFNFIIKYRIDKDLDNKLDF